jgi:hypothetical protein
MGDHSSTSRSTVGTTGTGVHRAKRGRRIEPYSWLGAGALTLGVGAALAGGSGIAHADEGASAKSPSASSPSGVAAQGQTRRGSTATGAKNQAKAPAPIATKTAQQAVSSPVAQSAAAAVSASSTNPVVVLAAASVQPAAATAPSAAVLPSPTAVLTGLANLLGLTSWATSPVLPTGPAQFVTAMLALIENVLVQFGAAAPVSASQTVASASGTTTTITWAWGTNPVINFNPATDKLNFGWMQASQFTVTESAGSTVISIVDNSHTYTLKGVTLSQLQMSNIVANDAGTVAKWQSLISTAQSNSTPSVSIADASVTEGNSGTTAMAFIVTLSKASTKTVTVKYATSNGTATAGQDYTAASGTITFAPGVTSQNVNINVIGDTTVEPDETFTVTLSSPSGATVGRSAATGTILNDDKAATLPTISIANASVAKASSGTSTMAFTVTLSTAATSPVTVAYTTSNGTATAGQNYVAGTGTITFAAGVTSQVIDVSIINATAMSSNETFTVTLSNPSGATIANGSAIGTITVAQSGTGTAKWGKAYFAPYVDMGAWPVPNLLQISQATGATLMTLGFIQADPNNQPAWAGLAALEPGSSNDQAKAINQSIAAFKAAGGDVMISFGGENGTSLAQAYAAKGLSAQALANAYASVINAYGVTNIDFDIEGGAVADPASIALNSQALQLLQKTNPTVQIWYTLPVLPSGLTADGLNVVQSALTAGVKLAGVNVMAMDYGASAAPTTGSGAQTMGTYAIDAAKSTYTQLSALYSKSGQSFSYGQLGVTPMIGVNDVAGETFTVADAQALETFAVANGIGRLSMWSINRDTPGTLGQASSSASGLSATAGSFSKAFDPFGTQNTVNYGSNSSSGSGTVVQGGTTTTVSWQWGTNTVLQFNPATDKLNFVWMQADQFTVTQQSNSIVISVVNNDQTYTLKGVTLSQLQMGNIVANDPGTVAEWQILINNAKAV